jgi:hypothetical protein
MFAPLSARRILFKCASPNLKSWIRPCLVGPKFEKIKLLGEAHLKRMRRAERGANIFGVFCVKNHDFTPKNHIFPILGGAHEIFGVFHVKNFHQLWYQP